LEPSRAPVLWWGRLGGKIALRWYDEQANNLDPLVIQAGDRLRFNLRGASAGEAKKLRKQMLGDRVK
jgi:hypothetical protein